MVNSKTTSSLFLHTFIFMFVCLLFSWPLKTDAALSIKNPIASTVWDKNSNQVVTISRTAGTPTGNIRICIAPSSGGNYTYLNSKNITTNGTHTIDVPSSVLLGLVPGKYRVYATKNLDCSVSAGRVQSAIFNLGPYISIGQPSTWNTGTYNNQTVVVDRYLVGSNIKLFIQPFSAPAGQSCREIGMIAGGSSTPVNQVISNVSLSGIQTGNYKLIATTGSDCNSGNFKVESGQFTVNAPSLSVSATPSLWWDKLDNLDQTISVTKTNYTGAFKICLKDGQGGFTDLVSVASSTAKNIDKTITDATLQLITSTDLNELEKFKIFVTTSSDCSSNVALFKTEIPSSSNDFVTIFSSFILNTPSVIWNKLDNNRTPQIVEIERNGTDPSAPLKVCLQTSAGNLLPTSTFSTTIPANATSTLVNDNLLNNVNAGTYKLVVTNHPSDCSNISGYTRKISGNFSITSQALPTVSISSVWDESDGVFQSVGVERSGITSALKVCAVVPHRITTLVEQPDGSVIPVDVETTDFDTYLLGTILSGKTSVNILDTVLSGFVPPSNNYKIRVTSGSDCDDLSAGVVVGESPSLNITSTIEVSPVTAPSGGWNKVDNEPQSVAVKSNGYTGNVAVCVKQGATYYPLGVVAVTSGNTSNLNVSDPINTNKGANIPGLEPTGTSFGSSSTLIAVTTSSWTTANLTSANCATVASQSSNPKIYRAQSEQFYILSKTSSIILTRNPANKWNVEDGLDQTLTIERNYIVSPLSVCIKPSDYSSYYPIGFIPKYSNELITNFTVTDKMVSDIWDHFKSINSKYENPYDYHIQVRTSPVGSTGADCNTGGKNSQVTVYFVSEGFDLSINPSSEWNILDGVAQEVEIVRKDVNSSVLVCLVSSNDDVVYKTTRYNNQAPAFYISDSDILDSDLVDIEDGQYKIVVTDHSDCINRNQSYASAETPYFNLVSRVPFSITTDSQWNKTDNLAQTIEIDRDSGFEGSIRLCIKTPDSTYYDLSSNYGYPENYIDVSDGSISNFPLGTRYKIIGMSAIFPCNTKVSVAQAPFSIVSQQSTVELGIYPKVWSSPAVMSQIFSIIRKGFGSGVKICLKNSTGTYNNINSYSISRNNYSYNVNAGQPVLGFISGVSNYDVKAIASSDCADTTGVQSSPISFKITGPVDMTGDKKGGMNGETKDDIFGEAFSSNTGWIKFSSFEEQPSGSPLYGVDMDESGNLSGYAWSNNIGWLSFNNADTSHPRAKVNTDGTVSGWAKFVSADNNGWDGWVSFRGVSDDGGSYGVNYDKSTGYFSGWAWGSDVVGWVNFNSNCGPGCTYAVEGPKIIDAPTDLSLESYCTGPNGNRVPAIKVEGNTSDQHAVYYTEVTGDVCPSTESSYSYVGDTTARLPYSLPANILIEENKKYCVMISPTSGYYSSPSGYDSSILASSNPIETGVCPDISGDVKVISFKANPERINKGGSCNLEWELEDLGPNSTCKLEFQNPSNGVFYEVPGYSYLAGQTKFSAPNIIKETKFKLSCWESGDPTIVKEKTSTCFINASFKETQ